MFVHYPFFTQNHPPFYTIKKMTKVAIFGTWSQKGSSSICMGLTHQPLKLFGWFSQKIFQRCKKLFLAQRKQRFLLLLVLLAPAAYSLTLIVSPPFKFNISFYLNNVSYQIEFETRVQLHRTLQISPCSIVLQFRQSP